MSSGLQATLSAVLNFSLIFGAFPMRRLYGVEYVFSWKLYSYEICLGLVTTGQGIFVAHKFITELSLSMALLMDLFVFIFYIITWVIILIQYYLLRKTLPNIILELNEINNRLEKTTYNKLFIASLILITFLNVISKLIDFSTARLTWDYLLAGTLYFFFTNAPVFVAGQYSVLLYIISRQLISVTEKLSTVSDGPGVCQLVDIHYALCNLAERVNNAFDIFLFHLITLSFVVIVLKIYIIIICIVRADLYANMAAMVITVFDVLLNSCVIILIVTSSMKASNNAERFNSELFKNLMRSNRDLTNDNTLRTYLNMKPAINQTACQFFSLDYRLLTSMAACTTTYVILLVQFTLL